MMFLTFEQVLELHESILIPANPRGYDKGKIRSIMGTISGGVGTALFHPTVLEAGAAYLFYFASGQSFAKGNKRTAVITCDTFLDLNGKPLISAIDTSIVWKIADKKCTKEEVLEYLKGIV